MSLWILKEKEVATISGLEAGLKESYITRLQEIGLDKGGIVTCIKSLPFGGPKVYQISDSIFSLEEDIANKVVITKG